MHENVRLSVERSRHSWSCPVKRLRPSGAERARAAMSGAPAEPSGLDFGDVGRCSVFEQPGQAISSGLAEPTGLERPFWAPQWSRAGSSGRFERPSRAERARAAISSAPAEPSGLDVANVGRCGVFEARPSRTEPARAAISRASCGSGPGSSGHFEPAAAPGQARAVISSQLGLQARLERPFRGNSGSGPGSMSQTSGAVFSSQAEPSRVRPQPSPEASEARTPKL